MHNNVKSATTAGLLGIFLGGFGVHYFYLGDKKKGIIHVCMAGAGIVLSIIASVIPILSLRAAITMAWLLSILGLLAAAASAASWIWGLVDGIRILVAGDAGLARRGIPVANSDMAPNNNMQSNSQNMSQNNLQNNGYSPTNSGVVGDNGADGNGEGANGNFNSGVNQSAQQNVLVKPPKVPMDPAKKKKILKIAAISGGAVVVGVIAIVVIAVVLRVDYSGTYKVAGELKPKMYSALNGSDCDNVIDRVNSTYTNVADYNAMVVACLNAYEDLPEMMKKLGETAGVKRNKEIKAQYDKINQGLSEATPDSSVLEQKLELYKAWHEFHYLYDDLDYAGTDAEIRKVAMPLINSGNETLKTFGEGFQEKFLEGAQAYRDYNNLSYSSAEKSAARTKFQDLKTAYSNWYAANKPDISELAELKFENNTKLYNEWTKLYDMIRKTYQENYNSGSGDCTEFMGEVVCS